MYTKTVNNYLWQTCVINTKKRHDCFLDFFLDRTNFIVHYKYSDLRVIEKKIDLKKCTCGQNVEISKQTVFMDQSIEL